jgi:hypothetical protein
MDAPVIEDYSTKLIGTIHKNLQHPTLGSFFLAEWSVLR